MGIFTRGWLFDSFFVVAVYSASIASPEAASIIIIIIKDDPNPTKD
jgi:hypothetical protein